MHTTAYDLDEKASDDAKKEVLHFEQPCPQCHVSSELCMKIVEIPHFKGLPFALLAVDEKVFLIYRMRYNGAALRCMRLSQ